MAEGELVTISLTKGPRSFFIRFETGQESVVLDEVVEMVHRDELDFDWFDAACLSHQVSLHLTKELKAYLPTK